MASPIYIASTCSIIAVPAQGSARLLGLVSNLRLEKRYVVEGVPEWGSFQFADYLIHGYEATFGWDQAYSPDVDLVAQAMAPDDVAIPQFLPYFLRVVDNKSQRNIALVHKAVTETYSIGAGARAMLMSNVSGRALSLLTQSQLN